MSQALAYSFDDEVASKFCYDIDQKRLEIHFTGCWDLATQHYHEGPCYLLIHQWRAAHCQEEAVSKRFVRLEQGMGIVSLLLAVTWVEEQLELVVNTIDNRYFLLRFANPIVEVVL
ncbi:hypothetical protein [Hymenobacter bucti]|uniref:Uncharacterized protein n=1 Tax=Hymenobacter bucti TaxID=1844114 RepID=A0ABW4QYR7_9BACT